MTTKKKSKPTKTFEYAGLKVPKDEDRVLFAQFDSSNLQSLAYAPMSQTLFAVFKNSPEKRYVYLKVPPKTFFKVTAAESVGVAFNAMVVKGGFAFFDEPN